MIISVAPDREALARAVADRIAELIVAAVRRRDMAVVAFSGGTTPAPMLRDLARRRLPWSSVIVLQVDERVAADDHPDRNATILRAALLDGVDATALLMPVTAQDLDAAAADYAQTIRREPLNGVLDVIHLGLGADGHTASLVPGDPVLQVTDADVAITGRYQGRQRMTLTYPALDRARHVVWQVAGADKAPAVTALLRGGGTPAARVSQANAELFVDADAATGLPDPIP